MCIRTVAHKSFLGLSLSFSLSCSSHLALGTKAGESRDDCITVSPRCCICHMDTRDNLWVKGQVNLKKRLARRTWPETWSALRLHLSLSSAGSACAGDSQRTFLRYTNSHVKNTGMQRSPTLYWQVILRLNAVLETVQKIIGERKAEGHWV